MEQTSESRAQTPITRMVWARSTLSGTFALLGAIIIVFSLAGAAAATPPDQKAHDDPDSANAATRQPAQQTIPDAKSAEIAQAIESGTVLTGMTQDQVRAARGEPARKEIIPPDAELWHYPEGEVAFSGGQVSYAALEPASPPSPSPAEDPAKPASATPEAATPATEQQADTATVNTPGDGFLALRSEPSIRRGGRLDKVPHGTVLTLDECRTWPQDGRWCRTRFRDRTGWAFERYLDR